MHRTDHRRSTKHALLAGLWLAMLALPGLAASTKAATHTVVIDGTAFSPASLTVKQGDQVVWVNKDPFPHTATAQDKSFDSGNVAAGRKWKFTARQRGEFPYGCTLHPTMKGTLTVK